MRKSTHTSAYAMLRRRLNELRTAAGLSQRQLAAVLRVPHSWVAKVEAGERRIDLVEFSWYCSACGVSPAPEATRLLDGIVTGTAERAQRRSRGHSGRQP